MTQAGSAGKRPAQVRMIRALLLIAAMGVVLLFIAEAKAEPTVYEVGPGHGFAAIGDVPWESLEPGDTVRIHWREQPYREKFIIARRGAEDVPIVVKGVPGPEGQRPVIVGRDATTRQELNYWNEDRGVIKIGGSNRPPDTIPAHIVLQGLEIRSGRPPYSFTGRAGRTDYRRNAASVFVEKGEHIVLRDLVLHDSGNGLFIASATREVLIEGCHIYDNGIEGRIYEHNAYTQARGIVYQHNRFGPLREGCRGNNLKDRSAGLVVRYNWIEGGNRQLDLVDGGAYADDPAYRTSYVYGNILLEHGDGNRQIVHYGGDGNDPDAYRKGQLFFYNNTIVSRRPGRTTLMRLSTADEHADIRNNLLHVTAGGRSLELMSTDGHATTRHNLFNEGWQVSFGRFEGVVEGESENLTANDPDFADLAGHDYRPLPGSPAMGVAGPLHPDVPSEHQVTRQWQGIGEWIDRADGGTGHIGALAPATDEP